MAPQTLYERKIYPANSGIDFGEWVSKLALPLVFTNGCFDILHRGHVSYLQKAAALGASLMVGINSDDSVQRLGKDPLKPVNSLDDRMALVAALESVDAVVSFDQDTPLELILAVKPDVLVKGGDWPIEQVVGGPEVTGWGGSVHSIKFEFERSTTKLIEKIRG